MMKFEKYKTIAGLWCNQYYSDSDRKNSLRSQVLNPEIDIQDYNVSPEEKKVEMDRMHNIRELHVSSLNNKGDPLGEVLKYYPNRSLGDGLVYLKSDGFISDDECPPWDTWFYFDQENDENVLYCWVPIQLVEFLTEAMEDDFYDCLVWHNDQDI